MTQEAGADAGKPDKSGSGAPEGGSPEGGSENDDKFEKRIKAALANQRAHYETQLGNVRAEFEAFKAGAGSKNEEPEKPQRYTRKQLNDAVDAGQISRDQADEVWAKQIEADTIQKATAAATDAVTRTATKERIDADIAAYRRLRPAIMENGSELREQIQAEFNDLVGTGLPGRGDAALPTQLAAIRAVLGPLDKLEKAAAKETRVEESEQQSGGAGKPKGEGGGSGKRLVDHLKGDAKEYYERGIKQGRYPKGWDDVEKELKFARPSVRQRLGLPA